MSKVVFLSHGGGPLPLLGEQGHKKIFRFEETGYVTSDMEGMP